MSDCSYMLLNINALKNKEESCGKKIQLSILQGNSEAVFIFY